MLIRVCEKCGKRIYATEFCQVRYHYFDVNGFRYSKEEIDLCPDCTRKLREFIKKGEN